MKLVLLTDRQLDMVGSQLGMSYDDETDELAALFEKGPQRCDDCGLDLAVEPWQLAWVMRHGNPLPRPLCPANDNGLHRIANVKGDGG